MSRNDYFTSLYLTRGHITWGGLIPEWDGGFDSTLDYYQHALIHALRFNRFLLDEALSGRKQGTPLQPITLHCLERGEEGKRMLVALRDWWQSSINDIGTPRSDTISPLQRVFPCWRQNTTAPSPRARNGSSQIDVVQQINAVLTIVRGG